MRCKARPPMALIVDAILSVSTRSKRGENAIASGLYYPKKVEVENAVKLIMYPVPLA